MISVIAPTRLVYLTHSFINFGTVNHFWCLPVGEPERLVEDSIFLSDPRTQAHEHYLVHGDMTGSVTVGAGGLRNQKGESIPDMSSEAWGSAIHAATTLIVGKRYPSYDTPLDNAYYYTTDVIGDVCIGVLWSISWQPPYLTHPEGKPWWMQHIYYLAAGPCNSSSYRLYAEPKQLPNQLFFASISEATSFIDEFRRTQLTYGKAARQLFFSERRCFFGENEFDVNSYNANRLPSLTHFFKFKEYEWVPIGSASNLAENYSFQHLRQSAFWDAISALKHLSDNMISSIIETFQFLLKVRSGKFRFTDIIPDSLSSAWLRYRYQYKTTKADLKQALEFVEYAGVFSYRDTFVVRGVFTYNNVVCRAKVTVQNRFLADAKAMWHKLYQYGLQPNMYTVWDLVPFSFIVDWFLPVGDLCEIVSLYNDITDTYDCVNVVYSLAYGAYAGSGDVSIYADIYSRWVEHHFPPAEFCYLYEDNPSDKTVLFRCFDAAALIIGRK